MSDKQILIRKNPEDLAQATADYITAAAGKAIAERGRFLIALSGGSTPEQAYLHLADPQMRGKIDWQKVYAFMGDERFVPPDDPRSNFGMAVRTLLARVPIPFGNVFPIATQAPTAQEAADEYEKKLAGFFGLSEKSPPPALDLIMLGLGEDGHTASLFPGNPSLEVKDRWFTASPPGVLPPPVDRITATFPMLDAAREILFLTAGAKKANILQDILENPGAKAKYPSAMVDPDHGKAIWLIDEAAAKLLKK